MKAACTGSPPTWRSTARDMARQPVSEDLQALHRRGVSALRVGPHVRDSAAPTLPGVPARTCVTRCVRHAARSRAGRAGLPTTAARFSTALPRSWRGEPLSSIELGIANEEVSEAIDTWVWYAGWADKLAQVHRVGQPRRRPVLQLHRAGADRRCRRARARRSAAAWTRAAARARPRRRQHDGRRRAPEASSARRCDASPKCLKPRTCPLEWSTC